MITLDLDSPVVKAVTQSTNPTIPEWEFPIATPLKSDGASPLDSDTTPFTVSSIFDIGIDKKRQIYIPSANTPSQLGFECDRNLVFRRTRGQDAQKIPIQRQSIFEFGKNCEEYAVKMLIEGGAKITETQRSLKDYDINLSAKIDCMIYHPRLANKPMLCEIKSFSSLEFPRYNKPEDFLKSDKHYYRSYYTQLQCYLYLLSQDKQQFEESAILFLVSKSGRETKDIRFYRDDDFIEENVIKKCERINNYVKNNILPNCEYNEKLCKECAFNHSCNVSKASNDGFFIFDEVELVEAIKRREELKDSTSEYEECDEYIKSTIKRYKKETGRELFLLDNYEVKAKTCRREVSNVPDEIKKQYATQITYDRITIKNLLGAKNGKS